MQSCDLIGEAAPDHCAGLGLSLGEEELAGLAVVGWAGWIGFLVRVGPKVQSDRV